MLTWRPLKTWTQLKVRCQQFSRRNCGSNSAWSVGYCGQPARQKKEANGSNIYLFNLTTYPFSKNISRYKSRYIFYPTYMSHEVLYTIHYCCVCKYIYIYLISICKNSPLNQQEPRPEWSKHFHPRNSTKKRQENNFMTDQPGGSWNMTPAPATLWDKRDP